MRVSTFQIHNQAVQQLQTLGAQTASTQQQIGHGKRLVVPGDDPIGAARVISIKQELGARDQFVSNANAADVQLALEESVLQQITDLVHRVQELTIQAGSGVQSAEDRQFIASEIQVRFDELMSLANSRNASGQYLFSGFKGETAPFRVQGDQVAYQGDSGQRQVQVDRGQYISVNDSGASVFMDIPARHTNLELAAGSSSSARLEGLSIVDQDAVDAFYPDKLVIEFRPPSEAGGMTNYTVRRASDQRPVEGMVNVPYPSPENLQVNGIGLRIEGSPQAGDRFVVATSNKQSLFDTVKGVANGLENVDAAAEPEAFRAMIDRTIDGLSGAMTSLLKVRSDIGARFNTIVAAKDLHEDLSLQLETVRSEIEDLDFAAAVSDLAYQSFVLEAAQQSFVRINSLSLFNRL